MPNEYRAVVNMLTDEKQEIPELSQRLSKLLDKSPKFDQLCLVMKRLSSRGCDVLGRSLRRNATLHTVSMKCKPQAGGVPLIVERLVGNGHLRELNLSFELEDRVDHKHPSSSNGSPSTSSPEAASIAGLLLVNTALRTLRLPSGLTAADLRGISYGLALNEGVTTLRVPKPRGIDHHFLDALIINQTLQDLTLDRCGELDLEALVPALNYNRSLLALRVEFCEIRGLRRFSDKFMGNPHLQTLAFRSAKLTSVKDLIPALRKLPALTSLNLCFNQLGGESVAELWSWASEKKCILRSLALHGNHIGECKNGSAALAEWISAPFCTLHELNIGFNKIGLEDMAVIGEALAGNSSLTHLHMADNACNENTVEIIARSVSQNTRLVVLEVKGRSHYKLGAAGCFTKIKDVLARNSQKDALVTRKSKSSKRTIVIPSRQTEGVSNKNVGPTANRVTRSVDESKSDGGTDNSEETGHSQWEALFYGRDSMVARGYEVSMNHISSLRHMQYLVATLPDHYKSWTSSLRDEVLGVCSRVSVSHLRKCLCLREQLGYTQGAPAAQLVVKELRSMMGDVGVTVEQWDKDDPSSFVLHIDDKRGTQVFADRHAVILAVFLKITHHSPFARPPRIHNHHLSVFGRMDLQPPYAQFPKAACILNKNSRSVYAQNSRNKTPQGPKPLLQSGKPGSSIVSAKQNTNVSAVVGWNTHPHAGSYASLLYKHRGKRGKLPRFRGITHATRLESGLHALWTLQQIARSKTPHVTWVHISTIACAQHSVVQEALGAVYKGLVSPDGCEDNYFHFCEQQLMSGVFFPQSDAILESLRECRDCMDTFDHAQHPGLHNLLLCLQGYSTSQWKFASHECRSNPSARHFFTFLSASQGHTEAAMWLASTWQRYTLNSPRFQLLPDVLRVSYRMVFWLRVAATAGHVGAKTLLAEGRQLIPQFQKFIAQCADHARFPAIKTAYQYAAALNALPELLFEGQSRFFSGIRYANFVEREANAMWLCFCRDDILLDKVYHHHVLRKIHNMKRHNLDVLLSLDESLDTRVGKPGARMSQWWESCKERPKDVLYRLLDEHVGTALRQYVLSSSALRQQRTSNLQRNQHTVATELLKQLDKLVRKKTWFGVKLGAGQQQVMRVVGFVEAGALVLMDQGNVQTSRFSRDVQASIAQVKHILLSFNDDIRYNQFTAAEWFYDVVRNYLRELQSTADVGRLADLELKHLSKVARNEEKRDHDLEDKPSMTRRVLQGIGATIEYGCKIVSIALPFGAVLCEVVDGAKSIAQAVEFLSDNDDSLGAPSDIHEFYEAVTRFFSGEEELQRKQHQALSRFGALTAHLDNPQASLRRLARDLTHRYEWVVSRMTSYSGKLFGNFLMEMLVQQLMFVDEWVPLPSHPNTPSSPSHNSNPMLDKQETAYQLLRERVERALWRVCVGRADDVLFVLRNGHMVRGSQLMKPSALIVNDIRACEPVHISIVHASDSESDSDVKVSVFASQWEIDHISQLTDIKECQRAKPFGVQQDACKLVATSHCVPAAEYLLSTGDGTLVGSNVQDSILSVRESVEWLRNAQEYGYIRERLVDYQDRLRGLRSDIGDKLSTEDNARLQQISTLISISRAYITELKNDQSGAVHQTVLSRFGMHGTCVLRDNFLRLTNLFHEFLQLIEHHLVMVGERHNVPLTVQLQGIWGLSRSTTHEGRFQLGWRSEYALSAFARTMRRQSEGDAKKGSSIDVSFDAKPLVRSKELVRNFEERDYWYHVRDMAVLCRHFVGDNVRRVPPTRLSNRRMFTKRCRRAVRHLIDGRGKMVVMCVIDSHAQWVGVAMHIANHQTTQQQRKQPSSPTIRVFVYDPMGCVRDALCTAIENVALAMTEHAGISLRLVQIPSANKNRPIVDEKQGENDTADDAYVLINHDSGPLVVDFVARIARTKVDEYKSGVELSKIVVSTENIAKIRAKHLSVLEQRYVQRAEDFQLTSFNAKHEAS